ncbi:ankycorbin isoform X3 [Erpetoichthys calabaricus]|uniref:ankycorbin isoform X3 n=1 Tax=Erpetoichthys calabaricus TaxID=27687 RepID=UPI0022342A76|nr:ankycorbin isoform X3 [Erpetoichthys calabaricus]
MAYLNDGHEWSKNDDRLLQAVEHGEVDKVSSLLTKKGVNAVKLDSEGKSALHLAAAKGQTDCLGIFLSHGVDVTILDASGCSALHLAAKNSHLECVKKLLKQGKCSVEGVDNIGRTALYYAAASGSLPIVQLLCENRSPVNVKDAEGCTPLLLSVHNSHLDVCKFLIDHGADINACDKNGRTAIMLASENNSLSIVEILIQHGADLSLVDTLGNDALQYSTLSGSKEIRNLLQAALSKLSSDSEDKTPPKLKQHDQVTRLNTERSATPKKRKAPPPPISPMQNCQSCDFSSPVFITPSQTPLSSKEMIFSELHFKEEEQKSIQLKEEIEKLNEEKCTLLEAIEDLKHALNNNPLQMALNGKEEQSIIAMLQAQIASLSLENKQLTHKLKKTQTRQTEEDMELSALDSSRHSSIDSNASYHSTAADFNQSLEIHETCADEVNRRETKTDASGDKHVSNKSITEVEVEFKKLQSALQEMQVKFKQSELEKEHLQNVLMSQSAKIADNTCVADGEKLHELEMKLQETESKYEEAMKELMAYKSQKIYEAGRSEDVSQQNNLIVEERKEMEQITNIDKVQHNYLETIKHLEEKLATVEARVSEEEFEAMKNSYNTHLESIQLERSLLLEKYSEAQEEIKMLQGALKGTVSVEQAASDFEEMKMEMNRKVEELQRQLLELTHLYAGAKSEVNALQDRLALKEKDVELSEQKKKDFVSRDYHERTITDLSKSITELQEKLSDVGTRYHQAMAEIVQLQNETEAQKDRYMLISEHTQAVSVLGSAIHNLEAQVETLKEQFSQKQEEVDILQAHLSEQKASLREDSVIKATQEELKKSHEAEMNQLKVKLDEAQKCQEEVSLENSRAKEEILKLKGEKHTIQNVVEAKELENRELQSKYKDAQELASNLKKQVETCAKLKEDKENKIEELTKEVSKLKDALNSLSQLSYTTSTPKRQNQQVDILQQQVKQLQLQLSETKKQHQEIVSVYRMHLLYAVQGQMDEDVQKTLKQILLMCKMPTQAK